MGNTVGPNGLSIRRASPLQWRVRQSKSSLKTDLPAIELQCDAGAVVQRVVANSLKLQPDHSEPSADVVRSKRRIQFLCNEANGSVFTWSPEDDAEVEVQPNLVTVSACVPAGGPMRDGPGN
jgi:hypothetical protein